MSTTPETTGDAFQRAIEHWRRNAPSASEPPQTQPGYPPLTVAISRQAGAGGREIAEQLSANLQWPIYDRELVEQVARDSGRSEEMVESVDEQGSSFVVETLEAFIGVPTMGGADYAHRLRQTLAALGAHGKCIIVGRGASAILPAQSTVSIRVVASISDRIARRRIDGTQTKHETQASLQCLDRERAQFVKRYFHKDIEDPLLYDLVLNRSRLSEEACVALCLRAVEHKRGGAVVSQASARDAPSPDPERS